ncbi:FAST kinase domain-containing protein 2, mitochondrial-like [Ornithodoros turicata]|uniref:FAST kinase domain-containing protein 2, mitochondrial-like n=1 Tax=Ornithodoros turicata TaxID=34597 RepID=UPI003139D8F5
MMFTKRAVHAVCRHLLNMNTPRLKNWQPIVCMSNHHGDISSLSRLGSLSVREKDADILSEELQKAKTTDKVFDIIAQHHAVMNNSQILTAFNSLYDVLTQNSEDMGQVMSHSSFRELCNRALKRMRFYSTEDVLTLLKITTRLGIPANTLLVQAICQMLRHSINSFSLQDLIFLDHVLSSQKARSSLTEALMMAIPLVFQTQAPIQLDFSNADDVCQCFAFAVRKSVDVALIEKLAVTLLSHMQSLNAEQASTLLLCLASSSKAFLHLSIPGVKEVMDMAQLTVAANVQKFPPKAIRAYLTAFRRGFYMKGVMKAIVKRCLAETWELWELSLLLESCVRCEHMNPELSEMVAERILKDPQSMQDDTRVSVLAMTDAIAAVPKRNQLFKEAAHVLANCREKFELLKLGAPHHFVKAAVGLTSLQCFPKEIFDAAFAEEFITASKFKVPQRHKADLLKYLLQLEQGVSIELKSYEGKCLPDNVRMEAMKLLASESKIFLPLKRSLEHGIGGSQFLKPGLWTKHGYFIDFVVVLRKGEYPVAINNCPMEEGKMDMTGFSFIEDLVTPEDSKVLTVITADVNSFWRDSTILKGHVATRLHRLSLLGYFPMLVNVEQWKALLDHEKIPFLMREMKSAISDTTLYQAVQL